MSDISDRIDKMIASFDEEAPAITPEEVVDLLEDCRNCIEDQDARLSSLEGQEPTVEEIYSEFQEWCQNNPTYDLDARLHTHSGRSVRWGAYISHEKTRVAFAAYRAGIKRRVAPPAVSERHELCEDEGCPHHGTPHVCLTPKPVPPAVPE